MTRVPCDGGQPRRMETCGAEEPYEGNLHVRFCGGIGRVIADPTRTCSGREGLNLAGASPVVPIARFRHGAIPQFVVGNHTSIAWCKPARLPRGLGASAVGAIWGSSKWG